MKKPIRVLVTGGGGDVCRGVVQCLEESQLDLDIFVAGADPHAYILYEERRSFLVPLSASEEYVGTLCNILNRHSVDVLIPTIDSEILKISQCRDRIERLVRYSSRSSGSDQSPDFLRKRRLLNPFPKPVLG